MEELERQEPEVPEQQEFFRQGSEPEPEPEPEPAVQAEPEKKTEPEPPPVEPSWLNEPVAPAVPQQEPSAPPAYDYQPQYPQAPLQQQVQPKTDQELEAFVNDPDGWVSRRVEQILQRQTGPLHQQQQSIAYMMNTLVENNVNQGMSAADASIKKAYTIFNQDPTFRSNKTMQEKIGATLSGMRERAVLEARNTGNFGPLNALANLSEADIKGTLAYVKAIAGIQSPGVGPLQVEGATVESSRAAVGDKGVELTPEEQEIARRFGPGYAERMKRAKLDQSRFDDLEFKE